MLLNLGLILGLASALVAISNDIVVHNKVAAELRERGDIFQTGGEAKTVGGKNVAKNFDEWFLPFWSQAKAQNGPWLMQ